ncbi:hypothetical protein NicSoilB4_32710 [Arthrobacter sp. NicSoilB4]|nr:hypothetical protein NicSoilB4_32710 [Arthrobacter sp. NicSoilB4]
MENFPLVASTRRGGIGQTDRGYSQRDDPKVQQGSASAWTSLASSGHMKACPPGNPAKACGVSWEVPRTRTGTRGDVGKGAAESDRRASDPVCADPKPVRQPGGGAPVRNQCLRPKTPRERGGPGSGRDSGA